MMTLFDLANPEPPNQRKKTSQKESGKEPYSPIRQDGQFACAICGKPAHFGFDVKLLAGKIGRWSCRDHIDAVKTMRR